MPKTNEKDTSNDMILLNVNVDLMQVLVTIKKGGIMINAEMNAKNGLVKEYVIKNLFVTLVIANVNMINHVMLENIQIMKIVSVEQG